MENAPFVALIDDDQHSAHLLTRMLLAEGSPRVQWYGDAVRGHARLVDVLTDPSAHWPSLVIVDLKSHSCANMDFLRSIQPLPHQKGVSMVAMVHASESDQREALEDCGAAAIFFRHADRDAYRREAASLVSFWARSQRPVAVGM
ncbi:Response regulator receiver domain-containing protein [Devosia sp. YR412]|nr:Response regulator receiver domain-containing protein [Devosia sp. YR412]